MSYPIGPPTAPQFPLAAPLAPPTTAPPGWYPNPSYTQWLWWDGRQWISPSGDVPPEDTSRTWFPTIPTLPLAAALLGIAVMVAITIVSRIAELLPETPAGLLGLATLVASTVGLPATAWVASRRWGTRRFVRDIGFRVRWIDIPLGIAGAIVLMITMIVINVVTNVIGLPNGSNLSEVAEQGRSVPLFVMLFVLAGIIAPVTEEIMFRGLIQRGLSSRFPGWGAMVIQGAIFGAAHYLPAQGWGNLTLLFSLAVMGVGLGFLAHLTGRQGTGIIAHATFNCLQLLLLWVSLGA